MASTDLEFLSITDLHFNPCHDPGLIKQLAAAEPDVWEDVFCASSARECSAYGQDTNYPLLSSLFSDLESFQDAAFILFSGDFLGHRLKEKYQAGSGDATDSGFTRFIAKTLKFLAGKFQAAFPGKVVFPSMGNDDNLCGDYEITPLGEFLSLFTETWQPFMDKLGNATSFSQTFPVGGYYTALLPGMPNHRLIVLNNIFMSRNYRDACGKKPGDPSAAQLNWLAWVLYLARAEGERVWLIFHEPLGINMYPALHGKAPKCSDNVGTFMKSGYGDRIRALLTQSSDVVKAAFCGHTHMDEFRLLYDGDGRPVTAMHVTPSVSPVFGNNPAYQVFSLDPSGQAADYTTRILPLEAGTPDNASWKTEYRFSQAYGQSGALTPASLGAVRESMAKNKALRDRYIEYYAVSQPAHSMINAGNWEAFYDCMGDSTREAFIDHYCPPHQSSTAGRTLPPGKG